MATTAEEVLNNARIINEQKVQRFLDMTIGHILDELSSPTGRPSVTLKRRSTRISCMLSAETGALQPDGVQKECSVTYSWPGKTAKEAWMFGAVVRILGHISEAVRGGYVTTKRDLYYLDPTYFGSQKVVDTYVDDIAYTIGVERAALHVTAAAKGLTAGNYKIIFRNGETLNIGDLAEGALIPSREEIAQIDLMGVRWILVVEKEAVFHRLVTSEYHKLSASGEGLLITGKGYPDLSTRAFLRLVWEMTSQPGKYDYRRVSRFAPICVLVDRDPDGLGIMSTYKYGSISQLHENAKLNVPGVEWLGLRSSDTAINEDCPLIPLTLRDRKKIQTMLQKSPAFSEEHEPEWRLEMQRMLMLNAKAEIEILYEMEGGLEKWLDRKLKQLM